jgi:lysozyme
MDPQSLLELRQMIERHEGKVAHAYQDHLGYWTIGVGRLIDDRRGGGLSDKEIDFLLANDIERILDDLPKRLPFWPRLTTTQQQALVNMAFQLGVNGLLNFKRMLASLERGDGETAEREALNSRWAQQTPGRATEVASMLRGRG